MPQSSTSARLVLKILNVLLGFLAFAYVFTVASFAMQHGSNGSLLSALVELGALGAYLYGLTRSLKLFDGGHAGLAFLLSIGGFCFTIALAFGACLATFKLNIH